MTIRSLESRVGKLEASRRSSDELLLVWRHPGQGISDALQRAVYWPGDRVICVEWDGDGPLPEPSWHRGLRLNLSKVEDDSLTRALEALPSSGREAFEAGHLSKPLREYTDLELWYCLFGVPS
jgi:hypothetical protein